MQIGVRVLLGLGYYRQTDSRTKDECKAVVSIKDDDRRTKFK